MNGFMLPSSLWWWWWCCIVPRVRILTVPATLFLTVACAQIPQQEFQQYTVVFDELKTSTERLLSDYDASRNELARFEAEIEQAKKAAARNDAEERRARIIVVPDQVDLTSFLQAKGAQDEIAARRQAIAVLTSYNEALTALAAGKSAREVKASLTSLRGNVESMLQLFKIATEIPGAGPIIDLATTFVAKLEEADNRRQFIDAIRVGAPLVQDIFRLMTKDAQDFYGVRAKLANLKMDRYRKSVNAYRLQMQTLTKAYQPPADAELKKRLAGIEGRLRAALDLVGSITASHKLLPGDNAQDPFTEIVASQLEQTMALAEAEAATHKAIKSEKQAYLDLVKSYGSLVGQTSTSMTKVQEAVESPPDLNAEVRDLVTFVFALQRGWAALEEARLNAAGS